MFQDVKKSNAASKPGRRFLNNVSQVDVIHDDIMELEEDVTLMPRRSGWFPRFGLKGGAPSNTSIQSNLRLINNRSNATRNICFTNAVVQMILKTGYSSLLRNLFPQLVVGKPVNSYQGCKALYSLYSEHRRERSAASVRTIVAKKSGKEFLANCQQQDAEEFLRALIDMMAIELHDLDSFNIIHNEHIGKEKIKRKFLDNSSGVCSRCGEFPSCSDQEFLCLKLNIPCSNLPVSLASLIDSYFSEGTEVIPMKCSQCCPHDNPPDGQKVPCPQAGFCSRPSVSCNELIKSPKYLFLQLLRFGLGHNGPKVSTLVKVDSELVMSNGVEYEVKATINHWGNTLKGGHYVAYLKNESGQWWLLNDNISTLVSLAEANTQDNYILLLERKTVLQKTSENVTTLVSASSSNSPVFLPLPQSQDAMEQYITSETVSGTTSSQSPSVIEDLSLISTNQAPGEEGNSADQLRKKVTLEEIEALIKLLEEKNDKTLIEKNELKKLKKID